MSPNSNRYLHAHAYERIAQILLMNGFDLRRHGGDFFIRRDGRFVCFLSFQPLEGKVYVETMRWNPEADRAVKDIIRLLADSGISMNTVFLQSRV